MHEVADKGYGMRKGHTSSGSRCTSRNKYIPAFNLALEWPMNAAQELFREEVNHIVYIISSSCMLITCTKLFSNRSSFPQEMYVLTSWFRGRINYIRWKLTFVSPCSRLSLLVRFAIQISEMITYIETSRSKGFECRIWCPAVVTL